MQIKSQRRRMATVFFSFFFSIENDGGFENMLGQMTRFHVFFASWWLNLLWRNIIANLFAYFFLLLLLLLLEILLKIHTMANMCRTALEIPCNECVNRFQENHPRLHIAHINISILIDKKATKNTHASHKWLHFYSNRSKKQNECIKNPYTEFGQM